MSVASQRYDIERFHCISFSWMLSCISSVVPSRGGFQGPRYSCTHTNYGSRGAVGFGVGSVDLYAVIFMEA